MYYRATFSTLKRSSVTSIRLLDIEIAILFFFLMNTNKLRVEETEQSFIECVHVCVQSILMLIILNIQQGLSGPQGIQGEIGLPGMIFISHFE